MERVDYSKLDYEVKVEGGNLAPEPKPIEDEKQKHIETLTERSRVMEDHARDLEAKLVAATAATEALRAESEARFNKLAEIVMALQK